MTAATITSIRINKPPPAAAPIIIPKSDERRESTIVTGEAKAFIFLHVC